jgi:hypothetical protein
LDLSYAEGIRYGNRSNGHLFFIASTATASPQRSRRRVKGCTESSLQPIKGHFSLLPSSTLSSSPIFANAAARACSEIAKFLTLNSGLGSLYSPF